MLKHISLDWISERTTVGERDRRWPPVRIGTPVCDHYHDSEQEHAESGSRKAQTKSQPSVTLNSR
jgi:hypothetical protein